MNLFILETQSLEDLKQYLHQQFRRFSKSEKKQQCATPGKAAESWSTKHQIIVTGPFTEFYFDFSGESETRTLPTHIFIISFQNFGQNKTVSIFIKVGTLLLLSKRNTACFARCFYPIIDCFLISSNLDQSHRSNINQSTPFFAQLQCFSPIHHRIQTATVEKHGQRRVLH